MSTDLPPDPNAARGEHDELVKVRCMNIACKHPYVTGKRAFFAQGCCCPRCGSSKAQLREEAPPAAPPFQESE